MITKEKKCIICEREFKVGRVTCSRKCSRIYTRIFKKLYSKLHREKKR